MNQNRAPGFNLLPHRGGDKIKTPGGRILLSIPESKV